MSAALFSSSARADSQHVTLGGSFSHSRTFTRTLTHSRTLFRTYSSDSFAQPGAHAYTLPYIHLPHTCLCFFFRSRRSRYPVRPVLPMPVPGSVATRCSHYQEHPHTFNENEQTRDLCACKFRKTSRDNLRLGVLVDDSSPQLRRIFVVFIFPANDRRHISVCTDCALWSCAHWLHFRRESWSCNFSHALLQRIYIYIYI